MLFPLVLFAQARPDEDEQQDDGGLCAQGEIHVLLQQGGKIGKHGNLFFRFGRAFPPEMAEGMEKHNIDGKRGKRFLGQGGFAKLWQKREDFAKGWQILRRGVLGFLPRFGKKGAVLPMLGKSVRRTKNGGGRGGGRVLQ
jgi:hypothetical protein